MKRDASFVMNPWPQERAVRASAAVRGSTLTPKEKRANREAAQARARKAATKLWAMEAFFVPSGPEEGIPRPLACNNVVGGVAHRLLWIAPKAAICAGGGCQGAVRELVFDNASKRWRIRPNHDPVARYLAIELFKERCVDNEGEDLDDARYNDHLVFDGNQRLVDPEHHHPRVLPDERPVGDERASVADAGGS